MRASYSKSDPNRKNSAPPFVRQHLALSQSIEDSEPREMLTSTQSVSSVDWKPYQRLLFLEGEKYYGEIGLDNGEDLFIDDVLETAQWYIILHLTFTFACLQRLFNLGRSSENYRITTRSSFRGDISSTPSANGTTLRRRYSTLLSRKEVTSSVVDTHFERYAHGNLKQRVL